MYISDEEGFLTLVSDPGDTVGWSLWNGCYLLAAGQTPMWHYADDVWLKLQKPKAKNALLDAGLHREGVDPKQLLLPIKRHICEDFRIYPKKAKALIWDPLRTPRLIGALSFMCRVFDDVEFHLQPAAIKKRAVAGGAEEFFYHPVHENRHQNDSIMHGWYYMQLGPDGDPSVPNNVSEDEDDLGN